MSSRDDGDYSWVARVADAGVAGVAAKADFFAGVEQFDDFFRHAPFVVFVIGDDDGRPGDVQQFEEVACVSGIFAGQGVKAAEGFAGAGGYVLQIADWGCNQSKCSHERCLLERMGEMGIGKYNVRPWLWQRNAWEMLQWTRWAVKFSCF